MEDNTPKQLVNSVALQNCQVKFGEQKSRVLDISMVRLVIEDTLFLETPPEGAFNLEFLLDRFHFSAEVKLQSRGDGWARLGFERIVPSARAHLRSFLSPKRVGESILEDCRTEIIRHFHGLNESELWFDQNGSVLFSYLDSADPAYQFIVRIADSKGPVRVGRILRKDYIELSSVEQELPLVPLSDRETYAKLGECRDVVTNFRPTGQLEYNLKQRLLKVISEHLYSTSRKVEMIHPPRTPRPVSADT